MHDSLERVVVWACCAALLLSCGAEGMGSDPGAGAREAESQGAPLAPHVPRLSEGGLYRVSLRPQREPPPLRELHGWIARVETLEGEPADLTRFAVDGGMPAHAHGFETQPRVTRQLGAGEFLIEGVRFHMAGDWVFRLEWVGPAGPDVALIDVLVEP